MGKPPKSSILIWFSIIFTIHFGGVPGVPPIFGLTPISHVFLWWLQRTQLLVGAVQRRMDCCLKTWILKSALVFLVLRIFLFRVGVWVSLCPENEGIWKGKVKRFFMMKVENAWQCCTCELKSSWNWCWPRLRWAGGSSRSLASIMEDSNKNALHMMEQAKGTSLWLVSSLKLDQDCRNSIAQFQWLAGRWLEP